MNTARRRIRVRGGQVTRCQVTDVDTTSDLRRLEGRAAPYDVWTVRGFYQLRLQAGCFDQSIKAADRPLPLLLWHDADTWPIGRATAWRSEPDGLYGVWELDDDPRAQRAATLARQGVLTGLSVGWQPLLNEWELAPSVYRDDDEVTTFNVDDLDRCTLRQGRLLETSIVATPQWDEAQVTMVADRAPTTTPYLKQWRDWRATIKGGK